MNRLSNIFAYSIHELRSDLRLTYQISDRCRPQGHWFEFVDYLPDFDGQCYMLKAHCEECGHEILEKVSEKQVVNEGRELQW